MADTTNSDRIKSLLYWHSWHEWPVFNLKLNQMSGGSNWLSILNFPVLAETVLNALTDGTSITVCGNQFQSSTILQRKSVFLDIVCSAEQISSFGDLAKVVSSECKLEKTVLPLYHVDEIHIIQVGPLWCSRSFTKMFQISKYIRLSYVKPGLQRWECAS